MGTEWSVSGSAHSKPNSQAAPLGQEEWKPQLRFVDNSTPGQLTGVGAGCGACGGPKGGVVPEEIWTQQTKDNN